MDVTLPNLNESAKAGDATPGSMQQLAGKTVQGHINTPSICEFHHPINESGISR